MVKIARKEIVICITVISSGPFPDELLLRSDQVISSRLFVFSQTVLDLCRLWHHKLLL